MLETSEPMVVKAYLTGNWWAIADYCMETTGADEAACYDQSLSYLEQRFGDALDLARSAETAGVVAQAIDWGYDLSGSYLGLPQATLETSEGSPQL